MRSYEIELTVEENALLQTIDLRVSHLTHDEGRATYLANREPIISLLRCLDKRGAIPPERLSYWNDPDYNTGRLKASHKEVFVRNGCTQEDIYTHPHFLPYLRYFLFGPDLPDPVILRFKEQVGNPDWVTSSDIVPIGKYARDLTRKFSLDRTCAAEEFFKLCLELRLGLSTARTARRSVMQLR